MDLIRGPRRLRLPEWCTGSVLVLLLGAFTSSVGVLFVAPYLSIHLYRSGGLSAAAVGVILGLSYWSTRASGLAAGALADRIGQRRVMLFGNGLRAVGYLLLTGQSVAQIVVAVLLVGTGSGLFFPVSKAHLLHLVDEKHQLNAIAARNVFANAGVAIGPLLGMVVFATGPWLLFVSAAAAFGALTLLLLRLPEVRHGGAASHYWRNAARMLGRRSIVLIILATTVLGLAIVQLESAFPLLVGEKGGTTALAGVLFLVNAIVVIVAQPVMVKVVTRLSVRQSLTGGFVLFASSFALLATPSSLWPLWLAGIVVFSLAEVWVSLWIDDRVREEGQHEAATIYGFSGLGDAFGGLGGALLGTALVGWDSGPLPGFSSAYWTLGALLLISTLGVQALVPRAARRSATSESERAGAHPGEERTEATR